MFWPGAGAVQWPPSGIRIHPRALNLLLVRRLPSTSQKHTPPLGSEGPQVPIHWRLPIWMVSAFISHVILPTTSCNQCYHAFTTVITLKKHKKTEGICWSEASNLGGVSICRPPFVSQGILPPTSCHRLPSGPQITLLQSQDLLLIIALYHLTKKPEDLSSLEIDLVVLGKY